MSAISISKYSVILWVFLCFDLNKEYDGQKPEMKRPLGRRRRKMEDNIIKLDFTISV